MTAIETLRHAGKVARGFADACDGMLELLQAFGPQGEAPAVPVAGLNCDRFGKPLPRDWFEKSMPLPEAPRQAKAKTKRVVRTRPAKAAPTTDKCEPTGLMAMVIELIKRQPLTSGEIFERLVKLRPATTIGTVYDACHRIKKANLAETRLWETDGQRRWHLIGAAA